MAFVYRSQRSVSQSPSHSSPLGPGSYLGQPQYRPIHAYAPFTSTTERELTVKLSGNVTPGPGAYQAALLSSRSAGGTDQFGRLKPTSAFASRQSRFKALQNAELPGPGSYAVSRSLSKPRKKATNKESPQLNFLRLPTAPSIPAKSQAFGYDETPTGELVMQKNPEKGFAGTPKDCVGPGHYSCKPPQEIWGKLGPAWDRSKRTDLLQDATATGTDLGPGTYSPLSPLPPPRLHPSAVFQSSTKRTSYIPSFGPPPEVDFMDDPPVPSEIPGPGYYCGPDVQSSFRLQSVPNRMQFFGSRVNRFALNRGDNYPEIGPGSYKSDTGVKRGYSNKVPFDSSNQRFREDFDSNLGPGSYRSIQFLDEARKKAWGRQGIFGTTEKRFVSTGRKDIPGPGYYSSENRLGTHNSALKKPLSVFQSKVKRDQASNITAPAPGQYEVKSEFRPKGNKTVRGRSQLAVVETESDAGFNAKSPRFPVDSKSEDRLGPGRYTPKLVKDLKPNNKKSLVLPQVRHR